MKKYLKLFPAIFLAAALTACGDVPEQVSETAAVTNQTIIPKAVETEREFAPKLPDGEYKYDAYTDHIVLTEYIGSETAVEIPAEIDGLPVTEIGSMAFYSNKSLTSAVIPGSVEVIGGSAFSYCKNLAEVTVSDGVKTIDKDAFADCENLKKITLPESLTELGARAFYYCPALEEINFPGGIETISDWTFYYCKSLTKIEIPENVKEISVYAFSECKALAEVSLPETTDVGDSAFGGTPWLESLPQPVIFGGKLAYWSTAEGEVSVPEGVERICGGVFYKCDKLTGISIPQSVKEIGGSAFQDCTSLKTVTIPDSVEILDNFAFCGCTALEEVIIPDSVTGIGFDVFAECYNLKNVTVPESFDEDVLEYVFANSYWYKKRCDETYVKSRENDLYKYDVYENYIALREYLEYDGDVEIPAEIDGIPVTEIGGYAFSFSGITSVKIPGSVTKIGESAFAYADITELTIPDSVTFLGEEAFADCGELTEVTFPSHFDEETIAAAFANTPWFDNNYAE